MPPLAKKKEWRLIARRARDWNGGESEIGELEVFLLELLRYRYFLNGKRIPIWLCPERAAEGATDLRNRGFDDVGDVTCWPSRHRFRLTTGVHRRELHPEKSESFALSLVERQVAADAGMTDREFAEWANRWRTYAAKITVQNAKGYDAAESIERILKEKHRFTSVQARYVAGNWTALINELSRRKVEANRG